MLESINGVVPDCLGYPSNPRAHAGEMRNLHFNQHVNQFPEQDALAHLLGIWFGVWDWCPNMTSVGTGMKRWEPGAIVEKIMHSRD